MRTLKDVLLHLARQVPHNHATLAEMERIIGEHFDPPEDAAEPEPEPEQLQGQQGS
ncbi:MAG: hypothetical protein ACRDPY_33600 [Streptosporangiaceae bacterium]